MSREVLSKVLTSLVSQTKQASFVMVTNVVSDECSKQPVAVAVDLRLSTVAVNMPS